jgi:hypothetical protein
VLCTYLHWALWRMVLMAAKAAAAALLAACVVTLIVTAPHPAAGGHKPQVAIIGGKHAQSRW